MRKFVYTKDQVVTIPTDLEHKSVENAMGGGYVTTIEDKLIFYGQSQHFGKPNFDYLRMLLKEEVEEPFYLADLLEGIKSIYFVNNDFVDENELGKQVNLNLIK